jgi:hypothetical protein
MSTPTVNPESHATLVPTPQAARQAPPAKPPKSPGLALLFALIPPPGLGQMYNGQMAKAMVVFFAFTGSVWACVESGPLPFAFFIPFSIFFGAIDAYRSAALYNARFVSGTAIEEDVDESSPAWGVILIALGLAFLLNNLGWLPLATLHRFWPLLLIGAGAFFLYGARSRKGPDASGGGDAAL